MYKQSAWMSEHPQFGRADLLSDGLFCVGCLDNLLDCIFGSPSVYAICMSAQAIFPAIRIAFWYLDNLFACP